MTVVTIITPQHRQRGGLNKPGRFVSPTGALVCSCCGHGPDETRFYKRFNGQGWQQPCGPCKYAILKAKAKAKATEPIVKAPRRQQVACPYPGCKFSGSYVELSKHRKEHDEKF
jgi:hypothetical protein